MNTVNSPPRIVGPAVKPAGPVEILGTVISAPPEIGELTTGTVLRGVVERQDRHGHVLVRTDQGSLTLGTPLRLASGSQVTLQLRHAGAALIISVLQIDGHAVRQQDLAAPAQTPGPVPAEPVAPRPASAAATEGAAGPRTDTLAVGQRLRATVVTRPPAEGAAESGDGARPNVPRGAAESGDGARPNAPRGAAESGDGARPNAPRGVALPAAGSQITVRILRVLAPHGSAVEAPANTGSLHPAAGTPPGPLGATEARPHTLVGTVAGSGATTRLLVATPAGTLRLETGANLPTGSQVVIEVAPEVRRPAPGPRPQVLLAYDWPGLGEALEVLSRHPEARPGDKMAQLRLPAPGPRLASGILFFLQALGGGDLNVWLGTQASEGLRQAGRADLLVRLSDDMAQIRQLSDTPGGEWRFVPVPLFDGAHLEQLRLFMRRRRGGAGGAASEPHGAATRFVVEATFSRLGELQLDGLLRPQRFDLMLRSRRPLERWMRRDIGRIFDEANALAGYRGRIGFQAASDWSAIAVPFGGAQESGLLA